MALQKGERKCFTYLWKIENISYCSQKKGEQIESPAFVVDEIEDTKWVLWLYPRGKTDENYIGYYLKREADSKGPNKVEIKFDLAFLAKDGSILTSTGIFKNIFELDEALGRHTFVNREDVFVNKRSTFLPQDTLIARCRIWKSVGELSKDVRCFAHTRMGVRKRTFPFYIENFSTLELEQQFFYSIKSNDSLEPLMVIDLFLRGGLNSPTGGVIETAEFCTLRLSLVDAFGEIKECNQEEFWFNKPRSRACAQPVVSKSSPQSLLPSSSYQNTIQSQVSIINLPSFYNFLSRKNFKFFFTIKDLMAYKMLYLPNDTLSMDWELFFSVGIVSSEIEEILQEGTSSKSKLSHVYADKRYISNSLIEDDKSLYDEKFLYDVKLKTKTGTFPAHKFILSESSSVFKAMFTKMAEEERSKLGAGSSSSLSNGMTEKDCDCVNIEDIPGDAIKELLRYIYTGKVRGLTWQLGHNLYVAAAKYAVQGLKNICSSYLEETLSIDNVVYILMLSVSLYPDENLKLAAQDYILKYEDDITKTDAWQYLIQNHDMLAAETLSLREK